MFLHLHTHSYYSFLQGLASPAGLAKAAADSGMPALALTDYQSLTGAVEFTQACREQGIQPILGLELAAEPPVELFERLPAAQPGSLVLLAMDLAGWASLCRLSSQLRAGPEQPAAQALPDGRLAREAGGLICLTGGRRGLLARLVRARQEKTAAAYLQHLKDLFPGRLYVELQIHTPQDRAEAVRLASLAHRLSLPTAASHDVHYLLPEQEELQRLACAIRLNRPVSDLPPDAPAPPGAYFISPAEMAARFEEAPASLEAAEEIASRCRLELPLGQPRYPEIHLPEDLTVTEVLRQKALQGAQRLYAAPGPGPGAGEPELPPEIRARLEHELALIAECGYESLFLMMEEIIAFARQEGIPVSSRGSAASSLVAHCLGITSPDPVRLNLYFERFLNPARATPPDIDTDLCSRRRDEVIRYVYRRYGEDRVAMVGTINRFRRRSALRETAKAHSLPPAEIKKMVDSLTHWRPHHMPASVKENPYAELEERYNSPLHRRVFRQAAALIGLPRHLSVHAGGVVIAPGPLTDLAPTQLAPKGVVITQLDLESIAALGLVKIDLLGIRGLTVLGDVAEALHQKEEASKDTGGRSGVDFQRDLREGENEAKKRCAGEMRGRGKAGLDLFESIPEDDPQTSELVRMGRTIGCFQIESPGMRATLKEIQARSVDDLMIALALYRPGPLTGGLKEAFVRRHKGEETASHLHPALAPLLADTHGVILYQEQVLRIAHELAGLSLADADLLRRAMSHFDPGERMRTLKMKFLRGALEHSGVPEPVAERVWELMAAFAGYGFPKAHAASYAQVAWLSAWCKAHHPALFMAAVLANWGGYYGQRVYLTEARRLGLALRPPHVNHARREFSVAYLEGEPVLFMGLDQVRDLTRRTLARILQARPFRSLDDFLVRADPRPVEAENLVKAGALEGFGPIPALLRRLGSSRPAGQLSLFSFSDEAEDDWSLEEKVTAEEAVLGVGVSAHPLELLAPQIEAAGALTTVEAAARLGQQVRVAGMRQTWNRLSTARGERFYIMSLEDLEGVLEVFISSEVYRRHGRALSDAGPYVLEGKVELNQETGEPFIRAERIWELM